MPKCGRCLVLRGTSHPVTQLQLQLELKASTVARRRETVSGNKANVILTYGANLE